MCVGAKDSVKEKDKVEKSDTAQNVVQGAITSTAKDATANTNAVKDVAVKEDTTKEAAVKDAVKDAFEDDKATKDEVSKPSNVAELNSKLPAGSNLFFLVFFYSVLNSFFTIFICNTVAFCCDVSFFF